MYRDELKLKLDQALKDITNALKERWINIDQTLKIPEIPKKIRELRVPRNSLVSASNFRGQILPNVPGFDQAKCTAIKFVYDNPPENAQTIDASLDKNNGIVAWYNSENNTLFISGKGNTIYIDDCRAFFNNTYKNIQEISLENFNTENATSMNQMFYECTALQSIDLSQLNTENIENIGSMFYGCSNLKSIELDIRSDKVKEMKGLIQYCDNLETIIIKNISTTNVTDMQNTFQHNPKLKTLKINNFDTSNVTTMRNMFYECPSLEVLDLRSFSLKSINSTENMFRGCTSLKTIYANNWTEETTISATSIATSMFQDCTNLSGARTYNKSYIGFQYANYTNGYFTNPELAPN